MARASYEEPARKAIAGKMTAHAGNRKPAALENRSDHAAVYAQRSSIGCQRKFAGSGSVTSGKKPVVTSLGGFAGPFRPQPPGMRSAISADLK
jgi:hypothetical protein